MTFDPPVRLRIFVGECEQVGSPATPVQDDHGDGRVVRHAVQHRPDAVDAPLHQQTNDRSVVLLASAL